MPAICVMIASVTKPLIESVGVVSIFSSKAAVMVTCCDDPTLLSASELVNVSNGAEESTKKVMLSVPEYDLLLVSVPVTVAV